MWLENAIVLFVIGKLAMYFGEQFYDDFAGALALTFRTFLTILLKSKSGKF